MSKNSYSNVLYMDARYQKYFHIGIKLTAAVVVLLLLYYVGIPIFVVLLPFIIAGFIAMIIEPMVKLFSTKFKLGRKLSSLFSLLTFLVVFISVVTLIIYKIIIELATLSLTIPKYFSSININNEMTYWTNFSKKVYLSIPPESVGLIEDKLSELLSTAAGYLNSLASSAFTFIFSVISSLPEAFIFLIIVIISTYFISSDKEKIKEFIFKQFPPSWEPKIYSLKNDLLYAFVGFIKAQLILITISIFIATTGLTIIGAKYAVTMGIIIGFAEIIPVVGTGTFFVPWIIYELITKNIYMAIGLLAIFLTGIVVRQMMEPKILGQTIGIYPLVALISIYVGLELLGVFGMILGPILVILIRNLNKTGIIHLWKE